MFGGDDDDDFIPAPNTNLASLFGRPVEEGGNASLTYTAPKQPRKGQSDSISQISTEKPALPTLKLIIVKAVETYKLEDGHYKPQGKLGAAVLGNTASRLYQLLLYKNKQQHITTTKITDTFQFTIQLKNYASFYDDKGQNWSVMFESELDAVDFAREVGIARACAVRELGEKPFYAQDLKVGEGVQGELGDFLEIRYTALPLVDGRLSKAIETNVDADKPQRVKIRKGVWEEALIGAAKGCKRLIILAAVLFGPWKPLVDPAHRLAVIVEVGRVKASRKVPEVLLRGDGAMEDSSESNVDSGTDDTSIKARGASISEALTNSPKTNKAHIISRMAKMGQPTLPLKGAVTANASDSEETEEELSGITSKPPLKTRFVTVKTHSPVTVASVPGMSASAPKVTAAGGGAHHVTMFQPGPASWQQYSQYMINGLPVTIPSHPDGQLYSAPAAHQVVPVAPVISTPSGTPSSENHMAVYLAENRTHNAEVRMGLNKVVDKVEQALAKLEGIQQQQQQEQQLQCRGTGFLNPQTLLQSIQLLVSDNERMHAELADKRVKLEQQNEKMYQLLQQKCVEQSGPTAAEKRQDLSLQTMVLALQQEKAKLEADLSNAIARIDSMKFKEMNVEQLKEEVNFLTKHVRTQQGEMDHYKKTVLEQESMLKALKEQNENATYLHQSHESAIATLQAKVKEMEQQKAQLEDALKEARQKMDGAAQIASQQVMAVQEAHKDEITKLRQQIAAYEGEEKAEDAPVVAPLKNESTKKLELETEELKKKIKWLESEKEELNEKVKSLETHLKAAKEASGAGSVLAIEEVKKIMNVMYKLLKAEFVPGTDYEGAAIRETILSTLQEVTLQYMKAKAKSRSQSSEIKENADKVQCSQNNSDEPRKPEMDNSLSSEPAPSIPKSNENIQRTVDSSVLEEKLEEKPETVVKPSITVNNHELTDEAKPGGETSTPKSVPPPPPTVPPTEEDTDMQDVQKEKPDAENDPKESAVSKTDQQIAKPREPSLERGWRPQPPPSPLFDDDNDDDDDDWLS